jgi:hypothetical protein
MKWLGWIVLVMGLWVLVSTWLAPFLGISLLWNSVFSGTIVLICGLWWIFGDRTPTGTKL